MEANEAGDAGGGLELDNDTTDVYDSEFVGNIASRSWLAPTMARAETVTSFRRELRVARHPDTVVAEDSAGFVVPVSRAR